MKQFQLALIPCTAKKNAIGMTPLTLYKGGPFALMMKHAQQRADTILIMSAKYGLLHLSDPVRYYDAYVPNLSQVERVALIERIKKQAQDLGSLSTLSYLPRAYFEVLAEAAPEWSKTIRRPYKTLPSLTLFKVLSNEIKSYGVTPSRR